jgi:hypothetical protein
MIYLETFEKYKILDKMKRNDTFFYYFKSEFKNGIYYVEL